MILVFIKLFSMDSVHILMKAGRAFLTRRNPYVLDHLPIIPRKHTGEGAQLIWLRAPSWRKLISNIIRSFICTADKMSGYPVPFRAAPVRLLNC